MIKYFRIYMRLLSLNFYELTAFRANFYNSAFGHLAYAAFTVVSIVLLTSRTKTVYGWKREELFLLIGVFNIITGVFRTIFTKNLDRIPRIINKGELDQYLLKPVDSQFFLSTRGINLAAFIRTPIACLFTLYILLISTIKVDILQIILFTFIMMISLILLYSIWFIVLTITIWFTNLYNLDSLLDQITGATRYPIEMYEKAPYILFLFLFPLGIITSVPAKVLLRKFTLDDVTVLLLLASLLLFVSRSFWKFALQKYASASS